MNDAPDVLIVGAGLAGLAAGRDLARAGLSAHLLDKSRGVSGRAATRWLEFEGRTVRVDHGAQYFTARGDALRILLPDLIRLGVAREWTQGFPTLDERGIKPRAPGNPRYACPDGMSALGKAFLQGLEPGEGALPLETKAQVSAVEPDGEGWRAVLDDGRVRRGRALLVGVPAPQALKLTEPHLKPEVRLALKAVRYEPCWSAVLLFESLPYLDWSALEISHPVLAWAALDHTKRLVPDPPALVLHATPGWSRDHLELSQAEALPRLLGAARELLGDWVGQYRVAQAHRWRYARPSHTHTWPFLAQGGLVFCGDWCVEGKVEGALQSGWAAADYLAHYLKV